MVIDAETVPFIDVTAARMLVDLGTQLNDANVRLVVARSVGQVRDVLAETQPADRDHLRIEVAPSVREAVAELERA